MRLIAYVYTYCWGLDLLGCTGINNSPLKDANNASDTLGKHKSCLSYLRLVVNCLQESHIRGSTALAGKTVRVAIFMYFQRKESAERSPQPYKILRTLNKAKKLKLRSENIVISSHKGGGGV